MLAISMVCAPGTFLMSQGVFRDFQKLRIAWEYYGLREFRESRECLKKKKWNKKIIAKILFFFFFSTPSLESLKSLNHTIYLLIKLPESPWRLPGLPKVKILKCLKCLKCLGFCKVFFVYLFTFLCYCNLSYYAHTLIIKKTIKNIIIQYKIVLGNLVILGIISFL